MLSPFYLSRYLYRVMQWLFHYMKKQRLRELSYGYASYVLI
jgi:hypothetical protein